MTDSFQAHNDDAAILEPSACDAFRACEETVLRCMCSVCGCPVYSIFWNSFKETEITTIFQMMWNTMSSNSFAIVKFVVENLKMMTLPAGFPVALCNTAIQFSDRHSNRSFLLLRIVHLVVDAVDVVDVSVPEIVWFPSSERLAFQGTVLMQRQILVAVEEAFDAHQHSNEESNVWRSATAQLL